MRLFRFVPAHACLFVPALALVGACSGAPGPHPPGQPNRVVYDTDGAAVRLAPSATYDVPLFPDARHDPAITTPAACLGHEIGAQIAPPAQIVGCFHKWAAESERVSVATYATSYEGRPLIRAIIGSPQNIARIDAIAADLARLADPRGLSDADARRLVADTPAIGWFGYSIHGDEVSGADASVAFGYHLIAGTGDDVTKLLDRVVVVIDPVMNPDGRQRIATQIEQSRSLVPNLNDTSMHRGRWPWGRGNHYLFDMNRDWLIGAAPETRGRWQAIQALHPQLVIDAHEMGAQDTYLFYPYAEPVNTNFAPTLVGWQKAFAADHSRAFDRYGWSYYTRDWADGWYPGYSDAWAGLQGAIGILYEQAGIAGQPLRRASGKVVTYRESVHAQAVSSAANAATLARNREAILADFLAHRRAQVQPDPRDRTFALRPGRAPDRERRLLVTLLRQGVEVYRAEKDFRGRRAVDALGRDHDAIELPAGTWLVAAAQPQRAYVQAALGFDPRLSEEFLLAERRSLEREGRSRIYDVTAWNLGRAFALDAYWIDGPRVARAQVTEPPARVTGVVAPANTAGGARAASPAGAAGTAGAPATTISGAPVAWLVDGRDDGSTRFAALAMEAQIAVHAAHEPFSAVGRAFAPGSLVVRRSDNTGDIDAAIARVASQAGVAVYATRTSRSPDDGPDLGARKFRLLARPRVAVVGNAPVSVSGFGHVWEHIDRSLHLPMTMIDAQYLGAYDLRRYNVLVIPDAGGPLAALLTANAKTLAAWVRAGGTLIAVGDAAAAVAGDDKLGLTQVRLRRNALDKLPLYKAAVQRELSARKVALDTANLWDEPEPEPAKPSKTGNEDADKSADKSAGKDAKPAGKGAGKEAAAERDAWMRRFSPRGAFARGLVDIKSWLAFGLSDEMPVLVAGDHALLSRAPVQTPVRLGPARGLRIGGLLWPEARERLAETAYVTVERVGGGQVILFATSPTLRAMFPGAARLLSNAIVYGPGLGANAPRVW